MNELLTKDTIVKTNLLTIVTVVAIIVGAFVSYTVAINRVANAERDISGLSSRIQKLEDTNVETQKLLVQISSDVRYIKERGR